MAAAPLPQIWLQGSSAGGLCRGTAGEGAGAAASLGVQAAVVDREAESVWWREMPGQGSVPSLGDSGGGVGGAVTAHAEEHCPSGAANTGVGVGGQPPAAWGNGAVTGTGLCRPLEGTRAAAAVWPLLRSSLHGGGGSPSSGQGGGAGVHLGRGPQHMGCFGCPHPPFRVARPQRLAGSGLPGQAFWSQLGAQPVPSDPEGSVGLFEGSGRKYGRGQPGSGYRSQRPGQVWGLDRTRPLELGSLGEAGQTLGGQPEAPPPLAQAPSLLVRISKPCLCSSLC